MTPQQKFQQSRQYAKLTHVWVVRNGLTMLKGRQPKMEAPVELITPRGISDQDNSGIWAKMGSTTPDIVGFGAYAPGFGDVNIFGLYLSPDPMPTMRLLNNRFAFGSQQTPDADPDIFQVKNYPAPVNTTGAVMPDGQIGFFRNGELLATAPDDGYRLPIGKDIRIQLYASPVQVLYTINTPMTADEVKELHEDINTLMLDMGVAIPPPDEFISKRTNSLILEPQGGEYVKYALNGKNPIKEGVEFTDPLKFDRSAEVQSVTIGPDGTASEILKTNIRVLPEEAYTKKWWMGHCMQNVLTLAREHKRVALQAFKDEGHNVIWLHTEVNGEGIVHLEYLKESIAICEEIGLYFTLNSGAGVGNTGILFDLLLVSPAGWRPTEGMPGMVAYSYNGGESKYVIEEFEARGYTLDKMYFIPQGWLPKSDRNGGYTDIKWQPGNPYPELKDGSGTAQSREAVRWLLNNYPVSGWLSYFNSIEHNEFLRLECLEHGAVAIEGSELMYASEGNPTFYMGLRYFVDSWLKTIAPPPRERSLGRSDMTTNDYREISALSPFPFPGFEPGIERHAAFDDTSNNQNDLRNDMPSSAGANKLIKPIALAYRNNQQTYTIDEEIAVFAHRLHPQNAPLRTEVPDLYKGSVYPDWYMPDSMYMNPNKHAPAANAAKAFGEFIEVAVPLKTGATLALMGKNPKYYGPGIHVLRQEGLPVFVTPFVTLKRLGEREKVSYSLQGIDNDVFPSYHKIFCEQGTPFELVTPTKPVIKITNGLVTITGKGKTMVSQNKGLWFEYTKPIPFTGPKPQGYWRAIIAGTDVSNPSPFTYSPKVK